MNIQDRLNADSSASYYSQEQDSSHPYCWILGYRVTDEGMEQVLRRARDNDEAVQYASIHFSPENYRVIFSKYPNRGTAMVHRKTKKSAERSSWE